MKTPILATPIQRNVMQAASPGVNPSGNNTQCCGTNCMTKYCFLGLSSKGCIGNQPYINCIGG